MSVKERERALSASNNGKAKAQQRERALWVQSIVSTHENRVSVAR